MKRRKKVPQEHPYIERNGQEVLPLGRRSEWYVLREDCIAKLRAYFLSPCLSYLFNNFESKDFSCKKRDFYSLKNS